MIRDAILVDLLSWFALVLPLFLRQLRVNNEGLGREWVISQARACRGKTGDKVLAIFGKTKGKTTEQKGFASAGSSLDYKQSLFPLRIVEQKEQAS